MKASSAIYRFVMKPMAWGAIACLLIWIVMRVFDVTQIAGWNISLDPIFWGGFLTKLFIFDRSNSESQTRDSSATPDSASGFAASSTQSVGVEKAQQSSVSALARQAESDTLGYVPRQGDFKVVQGGREITPVDGIVDLANVNRPGF